MPRTLPDPDTLYRAVAERDASFEGIFVVAVRTTGVFCRPGCPARTPRRENVEFFGTTGEALAHGYRPCKVCRPMAPRDAAPGWLAPLLDELEADPGLRLRDADLRRRGVEPGRVRRWFKRHHGMTFQAYQRARRIGRAFGVLRHGDKVIDAAFDAGYESLSGFGESFRKATGFAPSDSADRSLIAVTRLASPLGPLLAGAVDDGICLLEFADRRMIETQFDRLRRHLGAEPVPGEHPLFAELARQLRAYFAGGRRVFDLPLAAPGTPFQEEVWAALRDIPHGETRSYGALAEALGRPGSARAVARANGDNRLAILVPCHRVVGADGSLTGYGGGLWRKRWLLELERGAVREEPDRVRTRRAGSSR